MSNRHKRSPSYWRRQVATGRLAADDPRVRLTPRVRAHQTSEEGPVPPPPGTGPSSLDRRLAAVVGRATPRARTRHR